MLVTIPTEYGNIYSVIDNMNSLNEKKSALIIFCYGLNGERSDRHRISVKLSREIKSMGVAVFRFDYIGQGISDGEFYNTTLKSKIRDTISVMKFVKKMMPQIEKVIFLGFSDGASVAICSIIEARDILEVNAVLLWSPIVHTDLKHVDENNKQIMQARDTKKLPISVNNKKNFMIGTTNIEYNRPTRRGNAVVTPQFGLWQNVRYNNLDEPKIIDLFCDLNIPTCIVYPEQDYSIIPTAKQLESKLGGNITSFKIADADHTFNRSTWINAVFKNSNSWLRRHIL